MSAYSHGQGLSDRERALVALAQLAPRRADDRDDWLRVGMALHSVSRDLVGAWDEWSQQSEKYEPKVCSTQWRSFNAGGGVTLGTLVAMAKEDAGGSGARPSGRVAEPAAKQSSRPHAWDAVLQHLSKVLGEPVAEWSYGPTTTCHDFRVVRFERDGKKSYRPLHEVEGGWLVGDPSGPLPLYRLANLEGASDPILLVEGEKCAEVLWGLGFPATTSAHGASSAGKADWSPLFGRSVVLLPDNDSAGMGYAESVANLLRKGNTGASVSLLELPGLDEGGDIADFVSGLSERGRSQEEIGEQIGQLLQSAVPLPRPSLPTRQDEGSVPVAVRSWPEPMAAPALRGLAGEFIDAVLPHSEADPAALLVQLLAALGCTIGRGPHFVAEADKHYTILFAVLVGETSKARKGTSWGRVRAILERSEIAREETGLSSGEGLIWAIRDPIEKTQPIKEDGRVIDYQPVIEDQGVADKRLQVYEPEYAQILKVMTREGNTLSPVLRNGWDGRDLGSLTKSSTAKATAPHISVIGHITRDEVLRFMDRTEVANGFGNRFLWVSVRRSKALPEGGSLSEAEIDRLSSRLKDVIGFARGVGLMARDEAARRYWARLYPRLSEGRPGLLGAITGRAEANVMRLAMIYALLDLSDVIRVEHLESALAVWDYADRSAGFIFGDSLGDPLADDLLRFIQGSPEEGVTRTEIRDHLKRNANATQVNRALGQLAERRLVRCEREQSGGRGKPAERWYPSTTKTTITTEFGVTPEGDGIRSFRSFLSSPRTAGDADDPDRAAPSDLGADVAGADHANEPAEPALNGEGRADDASVGQRLGSEPPASGGESSDGIAGELRGAREVPAAKAPGEPVDPFADTPSARPRQDWGAAGPVAKAFLEGLGEDPNTFSLPCTKEPEQVLAEAADAQSPEPSSEALTRPIRASRSKSGTSSAARRRAGQGALFQPDPSQDLDEEHYRGSR